MNIGSDIDSGIANGFIIYHSSHAFSFPTKYLYNLHISTMMGLILPSFLPRQYTHIIGGLLFLYFGIKLIYDSKSMSDKVSGELEEVEEELGNNSKKNDNDRHDDIESSSKEKQDTSSAVPSKIKNIFFQCFLLTFMAEWGDRSQIATIALAAAKNPYGVTVGASFGHSMCTGLAVVGGRMLASRISEKTVSFWGGFIFLCFGVHAFVFDV
jgi:putative Ca2+/H+ antiporter (TMEM165/GDT1 family)